MGSIFTGPSFLSLSSNVNIFAFQVFLKRGTRHSIAFARNGKQEDWKLAEGWGLPATDDTWLGKLCPCPPGVLGKAHVTNKTS